MMNHGTISFHNSKKMLERAQQTREELEQAVEQASQFPQDMMAEWLRGDVTKNLRSRTNKMIYDFAERHGMSLHDVCMNYVPDYSFKTQFFGADGKPAPWLDITVTLLPMPLDLEHGPGYWKSKYYRLKERLQGVADDEDGGTVNVEKKEE